jgi:hypothetical protein
MNAETSLLPIDIGFDLRCHDMRLVTENFEENIRYMDGEREGVVSKKNPDWKKLLRRAGYKIVK